MHHLHAPINQRHGVYALLLAFGMIVVVNTAWAFQLNGYVPCKLCLQQREPYYLGAPLVLLGAASAYLAGPAIVTRGLVVVGGLLMLFGMVLGIYHSGVEWAWWAGPTDCGATDGNLSTSANDLFATIDGTVAPACDEAAGRFLGLSFAGWNVIASIGLAAFAFWQVAQPAKPENA